MIKLTSKQAENVADALYNASELYLEKIEEFNEEYDRIEYDAHYENRPYTKAETTSLEVISSLIEKFEELNNQALEALEILRVAEFGE